jgi:hypothetical protein
MPPMQACPDKNVICRCTSSSFTCLADWERLCDVVLTRLARPALYDVSVRNLAALVPASFPRPLGIRGSCSPRENTRVTGVGKG